MNPIAAYNGKAADYATYRLPYAGEILEAVSKITGLDSTWRMADIASGTGRVSEIFVGHVARVLAVEPNGEMREQANRLLNARSAFESVDGTAEHTTLPAASVDLITVGQAWHWFNPQAAVSEFRRILKPEGWVALIWNRLGNEDDIDISPLFAPGETTRMAFPMVAEESWEQYIGGTRSTAAAPSISDPAYLGFEQDQRRIFDSRAVNGMFTVEYRTEIVAGRLHCSGI